MIAELARLASLCGVVRAVMSAVPAAVLATVCAAGLASAPALASAQTASADAAALRTRSLAAQCAQCHGTDGRALAGGEVPGLAGMPAAYLTEQMKAFRAGTRPSTVMQQLAKGYSEAQIDQLARYFAAQGAPAKP